jgi:hypothetical protein
MARLLRTTSAAFWIWLVLGCISLWDYVIMAVRREKKDLFVLISCYNVAVACFGWPWMSWDNDSNIYWDIL